MSDLGVITGLAREADCLDVFDAVTRPAVRVGGASAARARALADELIAGGCRALLSFGIAGGLADGAAPGTVVVAETVVVDGGPVYPTSEPWRRALLRRLAALEGVGVGAVAGSDRIVATPDAKRALGAATGALAVDMESHAVAAAAEQAGVRFLAVRAVSDPVSRRLPAWLAGTVAADGATRVGAVLAGALRRPGDVPVVIGLAGDSRRALASLRRVARLAGPLFGLE